MVAQKCIKTKHTFEIINKSHNYLNNYYKTKLQKTLHKQKLLNLIIKQMY